MPIQSIEQVLIDGVNTLNGWYIYNVNYAPSFSAAPSSCTINFISEDGVYDPEPVLSTTAPYEIKIGSNITLLYYAVSWEEKSSPAGRLMEVKFIDKSFWLDKFFVGLYKRHGGSETYNQEIGYEIKDCLIIMGREVHPCDTNKDGIIDAADVAAAIDSQEACDPCPQCPTDKYANRCQELTCTTVFEVQYNFNMLLAAIGAITVPTTIEIDTNGVATFDKYFAEYDGPLRSVLQSWGADFGFDFFWDDRTNKLTLIDLRQEIDISGVELTIPSGKLAGKSRMKSLEGTESRASISYYQRDGEHKTYDCTKRQVELLSPLRLRDLYGALYKGIDIETFELSCAFSHYARDYSSAHLRDSFWWFEGTRGYGITGADIASSLISTSATPQKLQEFGDMQILKVITGASTDNITIGDNPSPINIYLACTDLLEPGMLESYRSLETKYGKNFYFILAYYNEEQHKSWVNTEQRLASDFIGKYYYKELNPNFCGGNQRISEIQVAAPDASAAFYPQGTTTQNLPFADFGYYTYDSNNPLLEKTTVGNIISTVTDSLRQGLVLLNRQPKWYPDASDVTIDGSSPAFLNYYADACIHALNSSKSPTVAGIISKMVTDGFLFPTDPLIAGASIKDNPHVQLIVVFEGEFEGQIDELENNPLENADLVLIDADAEGKTVYIDVECNPLPTTAEWFGLAGNSSVWLSLWNPAGTMGIGTPSQGFEDAEAAGYLVQMTQSYTQPVFIPKSQSVLQNGTENYLENTLSTSVNARRIDDADVRAVAGAVCIPNAATIAQIHTDFNNAAFLAYAVTAPREKKDFKIYGIDLSDTSIASIKRGLVGLSVSISDRGVESNYSFSNRPPKPLSLNVTRRIAEIGRNHPLTQ